MHIKHMFDRKKLIIIILRDIFLCLPPYNSNFRYFETKSLVPRTSNLRDSTIFSDVIFHRAIKSKAATTCMPQGDMSLLRTRILVLHAG